MYSHSFDNFSSPSLPPPSLSPLSSLPICQFSICFLEFLHQILMKSINVLVLFNYSTPSLCSFSIQVNKRFVRMNEAHALRLPKLLKRWGKMHCVTASAIFNSRDATSIEQLSARKFTLAQLYGFSEPSAFFARRDHRQNLMASLSVLR